MLTPDPNDVREAIRLSSQFVMATEAGIRQLSAMSKPGAAASRQD